MYTAGVYPIYDRIVTHTRDLHPDLHRIGCASHFSLQLGYPNCNSGLILMTPLGNGLHMGDCLQLALWFASDDQLSREVDLDK